MKNFNVPVCSLKIFLRIESFREKTIPLQQRLCRGAFHSQKSRTPLAKNPFVFKKNPSKIRLNPFVLKKSRTLFPMSEVPLRLCLNFLRKNAYAWKINGDRFFSKNCELMHSKSFPTVFLFSCRSLFLGNCIYCLVDACRIQTKNFQ